MAFSGRAAQSSTGNSPSGVLIIIFLETLVMPFYFFIGSFRLSVYRLYLLIIFIPMVWRWLDGRAGSICVPDILLISSATWMVLSLSFNHGLFDQWEFAGILVIETLAPYFLARALITNIVMFQLFVRWFFMTILALLPFAIFENFTGKSAILDFLGEIMHVYSQVYQEPRLGLDRAQVSMPHPILFGVFCAPAFALVWYVIGISRSLFKRVCRSFLVAVAVFSSLSSGAFLVVLIQFFLISWDEIFKKFQKRWIVLVVGLSVIYIFLEFGSNRNAFQIIASEVAFSKSSGYNRILIFDHAMDDILRNPVFGIGLGNWTRPSWLGASVDNFWLIVALRYGLVSFFFMLAVFLIILIRVSLAQLSGAYSQARTGYLISMIGIGLSVSTVHIWEAAYCLFMFLLGSGVWFLNADNVQSNESEVVDDALDKRRIRYTRFSQN